MATALATMRFRLRPIQGPALRKARFPLGFAFVSALFHVALAAGLLGAVALWRAAQPKTYFVNLVPAVAAVGLPQSRPAPPVVTARPAEPAPAVKASPPAKASPPTRTSPPAKATPVELPSREPTAAAPREMPPRPDDMVLPERALPSPPAPQLPRPGEKELPTVTSPPPRPVATQVAAPPPRPEPIAVPTPPPPPPGRPSGSAAGTGPVTLTVSDFPFAHYLRIIQDQISRNWLPPLGSMHGQQAVAVFEIGRDGQVLRSAIERTSGNRDYDLAALRAIADAKFPPLPPAFKESLLRVHLGFNYVADRG